MCALNISLYLSDINKVFPLTLSLTILFKATLLHVFVLCNYYFHLIPIICILTIMLFLRVHKSHLAGWGGSAIPDCVIAFDVDLQLQVILLLSFHKKRSR